MEIHFGKNVKWLRTTAGLNQSELGERFEVKGSTVGGWETGNSFPEFKILVGLRRFFQVDLESLVFSDLSANGMPMVSEGENKYKASPTDSEMSRVLEELKNMGDVLDRMRGEVGKIGVMEARMNLLERLLEVVKGEVERGRKG